MVKSVKSRKRKIGNYDYHRNVRKIAKKMHTRLQNPPTDIKFIEKEYWDRTKNAEKNFSNLGLLYNLNKAMKPHAQFEEKTAIIKENVTSQQLKTGEKEKKQDSPFISSLQRKAKKVKGSQKVAPRNASYIKYLLNKYGEDYKAMASDERNHDQETWKQIRRKINLFKNCTDQYAQFLKSRNLLDTRTTPNQELKSEEPQIRKNQKIQRDPRIRRIAKIKRIKEIKKIKKLKKIKKTNKTGITGNTNETGKIMKSHKIRKPGKVKKTGKPSKTSETGKFRRFSKRRKPGETGKKNKTGKPSKTDKKNKTPKSIKIKMTRRANNGNFNRNRRTSKPGKFNKKTG